MAFWLNAAPLIFLILSPLIGGVLGSFGVWREERKR